jgi:cysteine synthase A
MAARGVVGSIVTILCDGGERYGCTYYDDQWLDARGLDWRAQEAAFSAMFGA